MASIDRNGGNATDSPISPVAGGGRQNALNTKITSILSSTYADLEVRDALQTLDIRQTKNTAETRRNLRLNALKDGLDCNAEIVDDFGQVAKQLRTVGEALNQLRATTNQLRAHVTSARLETAPVNSETAHFLTQQQVLSNKRQLHSAFTSHFALSPAEINTLTSLSNASTAPDGSKGPTLDDAFFAALVKAKRIHKDSRVLLSASSQRLGSDILARSSTVLSQAYSKLHRGILRDFRALDLENPTLNASLRRALRVLAERPALFRNALENFAEGRQRILEETFYAALTGSQGRRAIEASAGEPLRYVGDMLAWAHGAGVGEREALEGLFISEGEEIARGIQEGLESEPWNRPVLEGEEEDTPVEPFNGQKALSELIDRNLYGVSRVLRGRLEMLVKGSEDAVVAYKIANLIRFYGPIFKKLMNQGAQFISVLGEMEEISMTQFKTSMQFHVGNLKGDNLQPPEDLGSPEFLQEALEELKALLQSYDVSVAAADADQERLKTLLTETLDSYLGVCQGMAKTSLQAPKAQVFAINCLLLSKETLSNFPFTRGKSQAIQETIQEMSSELATYQTQFLLTQSGLQPMLAAVEKYPADADIQSLLATPPFKRDPLIETSQKLDEFLPSALMDAMENVKRLQNSTLAHQVNSKAANNFCEAFEKVAAKVETADEAQGELPEDQLSYREMFPRTTEEIRILLS